MTSDEIKLHVLWGEEALAFGMGAEDLLSVAAISLKIVGDPETWVRVLDGLLCTFDEETEDHLRALLDWDGCSVGDPHAVPPPPDVPEKAIERVRGHKPQGQIEADLCKLILGYCARARAWRRFFSEAP